MAGEHQHVVVTGGLGFIGSRLCAALLREGRDVVAVDDLRSRYSPLAGAAAARRLRAQGARVIEADVFGAALPTADAILHLAALPGVRTTRPVAEIWRANTALSERLLASAAGAGARFVLGSTSSVYGDARMLPTPETTPPAPLNPYAASKLAAEAAVRGAALAGADALSVRMFTVYGPGQRPDMAFARWIAGLTARRALRWCAAPDAARDFTYVDDAVAGLIAALDHGRAGAVYNLSGGRPVALADALALLEEITGRRARLDSSPPSGREARVTSGCLRRSASDLGYRPQTDLETGLHLQVAAAAGATPWRRRSVPPGAQPAPSRFDWESAGVAPESESPPRPVPPAAATCRG